MARKGLPKGSGLAGLRPFPKLRNQQEYELIYLYQKILADPDGVFDGSISQAFFTAKGPIRHGSVKLPGSLSFWGKLLWMIAEHSSLSLTEEVALSSFSLWERSSFRTLAPFGMWIMASRNGRLIWICLQMDRSRSLSSSFFCFFTLDGKDRFDNLEG
ncbi:hypothetical protein Tco_0417669 [Tanacetum coccineum]